MAAAFEPGEPVVAAGHSLGAGVSLCLGSGFFRPDVRAVVGVGLKVIWTDDDVTGMAKVAAKGVRHFDTRDEAADRFLRQAGLDGLVGNDHPATTTGVTQDPGRAVAPSSGSPDVRPAGVAHGRADGGRRCRWHPRDPGSR